MIETAGHGDDDRDQHTRSLLGVLFFCAKQIVKQTVMTNVYGVTFVGARQQIANRLKEKEVVAEEDMYKCSIYITRQVRRPR